MSAPLRCAVCEVELTVADAEDAVSTDAGPVHRECFEGPLPSGSELTVEDQAALERDEEDARRDHNDVPLPWSEFPEAMLGVLNSAMRPDDGFDRYDPEDARTRREIREDSYSFGEERPC